MKHYLSIDLKDKPTTIHESQSNLLNASRFVAVAHIRSFPALLAVSYYINLVTISTRHH